MIIINLDNYFKKVSRIRKHGSNTFQELSAVVYARVIKNAKGKTSSEIVYTTYNEALQDFIDYEKFLESVLTKVERAGIIISIVRRVYLSTEIVNNTTEYVEYKNVVEREIKLDERML